MIELAPAHLVGTGGALGAVARHLLTQRVHYVDLPAGTFAVNVLGSFLLGALVFGGVTSDLLLLLGVGFCGAFTTFSTFAFETVRLWETGDPGRSIGYAFVTLLTALGGVGLGWLVWQVV